MNVFSGDVFAVIASPVFLIPIAIRAAQGVRRAVVVTVVQGK